MTRQAATFDSVKQPWLHHTYEEIDTTAPRCCLRKVEKWESRMIQSWYMALPEITNGHWLVAAYIVW